jgi:hypothetical protein
LIGRSHRIANGYLADPYPRKGRPGFSAVELQGEFSVFDNPLFLNCSSIDSKDFPSGSDQKAAGDRKGNPKIDKRCLKSVEGKKLFFGTKDRVVGESRFTKVDPSLLLIFTFKVSAQKNESIPLLPFREFGKTVRTGSAPKLD